jgi:hypothetical protein
MLVDWEPKGSKEPTANATALTAGCTMEVERLRLSEDSHPVKHEVEIMNNCVTTDNRPELSESEANNKQVSLVKERAGNRRPYTRTAPSVISPENEESTAPSVISPKNEESAALRPVRKPPSAPRKSKTKANS